MSSASTIGRLIPTVWKRLISPATVSLEDMGESSGLLVVRLWIRNNLSEALTLEWVDPRHPALIGHPRTRRRNTWKGLWPGSVGATHAIRVPPLHPEFVAKPKLRVEPRGVESIDLLVNMHGEPNEHLRLVATCTFESWPRRMRFKARLP